MTLGVYPYSGYDPSQTRGQNGNWTANSKAYGYPAFGANQANYGAFPTAAAGYAGAASNEPIEDSGITVGEITGWRMWNIKGEWLEAYSAGHIWAPDENMEGKVPDHGYEGIWSFKDKRMAIKKMMELTPTAYGSIKMWGKVVEHEIGYRAEFAKIVSIDGVNLGRDSIFSVEKKRLLSLLRDNYGVANG